MCAVGKYIQYEEGKAITEKRGYEEILAEESKYWGHRARARLKEGFVPDLQVAFRKKNSRALWDDSEINFFVRGKYITKLLNASCSKNGMKCLELCCGAGSLALEAARKGAHVTGIDISSEAVLIGRQYQAKISKQPISGKVNLIVGDLNAIRLPQKKYGSVFVWDGLHHISEIDHLVSEVSKTLQDDGVFVIHDHVSPPKWSRLLAWITSELISLILPTRDSLSTKFKNESRRYFAFILKKTKLHRPGRQGTKSQVSKEALTSPFEDVSGENIIDSVGRHFRITELERYSSISHLVVGRIRPDCIHKYGLIRFVCTLDAFLTSLRILKPEYFFLIARKGSSP